MTNEETISVLRHHFAILNDGILTPKLDEAENMACEALCKQIPQLPSLDGDGFADGNPVYDTWECPCCGKKFDIYDEYAKYCQNCGQKLDTTEIDEVKNEKSNTNNNKRRTRKGN